MIPVIAIVGRPNVGKSTLFNYLTKSQKALVANAPGVTRDRLYGEGKFADKTFIVIDTGGLDKHNDKSLQAQMMTQTLAAIAEANAILFVVDARKGLTTSEYDIAQQLRETQKPIYLLVNKVDDLEEDIACSDFYALGFANTYAIASAQGKGIATLMENVLATFPSQEIESSPDTQKLIKVAIIGRPNVGKSTLVNRILGEQRVVVYDQPGTTRDSIYIPFQHNKKNYLLIDTAGVRRRRSINEAVEKSSVVKTLQAITEANVVLFVIDAQENIADQDLHLIGFAVDAGRALVIAINKWDGLSIDQREAVQKNLDRRLRFIDYVRIHFISALHGTGVGNLFKSINEAYQSANKKVSTPKLTQLLEKAVAQHQPPLVRGRRIKLRYAHLGGNNPPLIVIHGNQTQAVSASYLRYLASFFRKTLHFMGTPIHIELKSSDNPYQGKKNVLTPRQQKRRRRLIKNKS